MSPFILHLLLLCRLHGLGLLRLASVLNMIDAFEIHVLHVQCVLCLYSRGGLCLEGEILLIV